MRTTPILGAPIAVGTMAEVIGMVNGWIREPTRTRLVSFTNVHMVVEANLRPRFMSILRNLDLNCPDGAPIYWLVRNRLGRQAHKIAGPEFMPAFCEQSAALGHRHFLYGGAPGVAEAASAALSRSYPGIQVVGQYCPPFRQLTVGEYNEVGSMICDSGADVVWVCLGCPKQEQWMWEMRHRLEGKVVLAVGQAFEIVSGQAKRAPAFLRTMGLEWLYRLAREPRRLLKRYMVTNLLFVMLLLRETLTIRHTAVLIAQPEKFPSKAAGDDLP